jgi:hypothetical protein
MQRRKEVAKARKENHFQMREQSTFVSFLAVLSVFALVFIFRFYNPKEGLTRSHRDRRVKNILRAKVLTPWSFFSASLR